MSGTIIPFPGKWGSAYRGAETIETPRRRQKSQLRARVKRITALLAELEDLSSGSSDASAMLTQARATICRVEQRTKALGSKHSAMAVVDDKGEPQPHVDRDVLERHFRPRDAYQ